MQSKQPATAAQQSELNLFVLDVLRHDAIEQLSSIVRLMNDASGCIGWREFWPHDFSEAEVAPALLALEREGYVRALREIEGENDVVAVPCGQLESDILADVWFGLTEKGRRLLHGWQPRGS